MAGTDYVTRQIEESVMVKRALLADAELVGLVNGWGTI